MLKVSSYKRSGTHYLMAMLAANFKFNEDLAVTATSRAGNKWMLNDLTTAVVPWGKLFGTHEPYKETDNKDLIYIYRNPLDVLRSLWEFMGKPGISLNEFATDYKINEWKSHVDSYCDAGIYSIKYEQLRMMPIKTMMGIKQNFALKLKDVKYSIITKRVGWKEKVRINERDGFSLDTIDRFRAILGENYRGYMI